MPRIYSLGCPETDAEAMDIIVSKLLLCKLTRYSHNLHQASCRQSNNHVQQFATLIDQQSMPYFAVWIYIFQSTHEDKDYVHIVMELCQGGELFDHIVEAQHFNEKKVSACMMLLLLSLLLCHGMLELCMPVGHI